MIPVFSRGFPPSRPILIDRLGDMDVKLVIILTGLLRTNAAFAIARGQQQRPGRLRGMDKGGEVLPRGLDAPVSRGNDSLGSGLGWWNHDNWTGRTRPHHFRCSPLRPAVGHLPT